MQQTREAAEQFGFTNDPRPHSSAVVAWTARLSQRSSRPEVITATHIHSQSSSMAVG